MNNWIKYTKKEKIDKTNHSERILDVLGNLMPNLFNKKIDSKERTSLIKKELSKLGHEFCFKVYANGLLSEDKTDIENAPIDNKCKNIGGRFKNREWLFDLHWYTEVNSDNDHNKAYMPISLPLIMECEWKNTREGDDEKTRYGSVRFDFQKLVISNAALRLLIFRVRKVDIENDLKELGIYFDAVINDTYIHLENNAKFLFVAFEEKKGFYYMEITKK